MENSILNDLHVDSEASGYLSETARWAKFLAIVGLIAAGFMILGGLLTSLFMSATSDAQAAQLGDSYRTGLAAARGFLMFFYVIFGIIAILPNIYMLKFSNRMKAALQSADQDSLTAAFGSLKSLYKFSGVLTIIALAFVALGLLIGIIFGALAAGA